MYHVYAVADNANIAALHDIHNYACMCVCNAVCT